jgi:hypothetical protein
MDADSTDPENLTSLNREIRGATSLGVNRGITFNSCKPLTRYAKTSSLTAPLAALTSFFLLLAVPQSSSAAGNTIGASVEIKSPILITCSSDLNFGKIKSGHTEGTVVVTTSNNRFATGGANTRGHRFHPAIFHVSGQPGSFYNIDITAGPAVHVRHYEPNPCDCNFGGDGDDDDNEDGDDNGDELDDDDFDDDGDRQHRGDKSDRTQPADVLQVLGLTCVSSTVGAEGFLGQIANNGTDRLVIGGTLLVPTNAENGFYICHVELSVNY